MAVRAAEGIDAKLNPLTLLCVLPAVKDRIISGRLRRSRSRSTFMKYQYSKNEFSKKFQHRKNEFSKQYQYSKNEFRK